MAQVRYPGLPDHPGHAIAATADGRRLRRDAQLRAGRRLCRGQAAGRSRRELFQLAVSLGAVESLIEQPASMSHASYAREDRLAHGITDGLVRLSRRPGSV